jgi:hypothetical protein
MYKPQAPNKWELPTLTRMYKTLKVRFGHGIERAKGARHWWLTPVS